MKKILFVCTGNSCRSVMAQGLLKDLLRKMGRNDIQVLSAGISTVEGMGATQETIEVMAREGIDVSGHIGQPVTQELINSADLIFCMEEFHRELIVARVPESQEKVYLLKIFENPLTVKDPNILDPIGRPKEVYESCLMTIKEAVGRLAAWLKRQ